MLGNCHPFPPNKLFGFLVVFGPVCRTSRPFLCSRLFSLPSCLLEWWNVCFAFWWVPDIIRSCFLSVWLRLIVLSCLSVTAGATGSCESRRGGGEGGAWSSAEFTICEPLSRAAAGGSRVTAHSPKPPQNISGLTIND